MKNRKNNTIRSNFSLPILGKSTNRRIFNIFEKTIAFSMIIVLVMLWSYIPIKSAEAAGIDSVVTTLVTTEAVNGETQITVVFSPTTAITTGDTITIYLGENSGGDPWVDTDGTIDNTDVSCVQAGAVFDTYVQTDASGTAPLSVSCNVVSGGDTSSLTVTIGDGLGDDLYNPSTADGYSVAVITNDDSGAGIAYVGNANDVTVSATVLPNLALTIDNADATNCTTTSGVTSCDLGTILTTTLGTGNYDVNVGTNATSGVTLYIAEDGNLRNGADDISDTNEANGAITADGVEEYGIGIIADASWTEQGDFTDDDTPIASGPTSVATTAGGISIAGDDVTATHTASIASTTVATTYTHIVSWTATANF